MQNASERPFQRCLMPMTRFKKYELRVQLNESLVMAEMPGLRIALLSVELCRTRPSDAHVSLQTPAEEDGV